MATINQIIQEYEEKRLFILVIKRNDYERGVFDILEQLLPKLKSLVVKEVKSKEDDEAAIDAARAIGILSGAPLRYFIDGYTAASQSPYSVKDDWVRVEDGLPD